MDPNPESEGWTLFVCFLQLVDVLDGGTEGIMHFKREEMNGGMNLVDGITLMIGGVMCRSLLRG